jgi:hypothetical protein
MSEQNTFRFPTSNERDKCVSLNATKRATEAGVLREMFRSRFQDFRSHERCPRIFASSFEVDIQVVP